MKRSGGIGLLVVFAEWCPVCHEYSKAFHDADVIKALQGITLMRIDQDSGDKLIRKFTPDGEYVPRTFFLDSNGEPITGLFDADPAYKYFFPPDEPGDLAKTIRAMKTKALLK
jgi:protein-disulfide reductase (glutathione)